MLSHTLYIIVDESNRKKIGVTNDIDKRLKTLQTGNPEKLKVIWYEDGLLEPTKLERHLHRQFASNRLNGEWFKDLKLDDIRIQIFLFNSLI